MSSRGPFVTALGKNWCPDHFKCVNAQCRRPLADIGFVEEKGELYCEYCFEKYLAPTCDKCNTKVKGVSWYWVCFMHVIFFFPPYFKSQAIGQKFIVFLKCVQKRGTCLFLSALFLTNYFDETGLINNAPWNKVAYLWKPLSI